MNNIAIVEIREVYGNRTIYPMNAVADCLALLAGTKTLTDKTINIAKSMGYIFEVKQTTTI